MVFESLRSDFYASVIKQQSNEGFYECADCLKKNTVFTET
jgi:hypothetical protein